MTVTASGENLSRAPREGLDHLLPLPDAVNSFGQAFLFVGGRILVLMNRPGMINPQSNENRRQGEEHNVMSFGRFHGIGIFSLLYAAGTTRGASTRR